MDRTDWLDELGPSPGPPFLRMGTRALGGPWLLDGPDVPGQLAEKQRILGEHHADAVVIGAAGGTEEAGAELLALLGVGAGAAGVHPLDAAGRLVAEDLCLLAPDGGGRWVLTAGTVCFPSHWRLRDKVGLPIALVHGPVPHYAAELAERVDRFLDRLRPGPGVWRRNWTVHASPELFVPDPPPAPDPPVTVSDAGHRLWLRSERQTLRRLPGTGAVVFGIRTQQVPLRAVAAHPELRAQLAATVAAWSPDLLAYRGGDPIRRPLLAWLQSSRN